MEEMRKGKKVEGRGRWEGGEGQVGGVDGREGCGAHLEWKRVRAT